VTRLSSAWRWAVAWFEHGDLVPLLVIVSAVHYAAVLAGRDLWPVAVAIGLLVDLGHYRTIRRATHYQGDSRAALYTRWAIAGVMTAISFGYHQRYYGDLLLSLPMPFLIAVLAWMQQPATQTAKPAKQTPQPVAQPVEEKSTCVEKIETLLRENETARNWPAEQVADSVGCSATYVRREFRRNGDGWEKRKEIER
jgi:hypothetical protein